MGVPIVLAHGLRLSASMWKPQLAQLREQGRCVVAPDLPGHGERQGETFSLDSAVQTLQAAIDDVGGRALVVGLSLGGFVGIAAAAADPQRVAGLVAVSCTVQPVTSLTQMYRLPSVLLDRLPDRGKAVNSAFHRLTLPADGAEAALEGGLSMEVAPEVIDEISTMDTVELLESYPGPVWLVNGARDHFRIHERRFLEACTEGRLLAIPRAGHMVSLDQPDVFARVVCDAADVVTVRTGL
ncbi:alpha/beta hydrolase [Lipingzhangella sp. LS1_29]|uniref:Alpha/beta hydrolase n=1 Tax=Lipingzhangella rawalii TaxID=2055835 RepID=A0ABU2H1E5_9ACTN|nr:alpha/beta hydrolase [Lipingzhangella rawalii]MDS1269142.1 alpha/beta hydrolase [Lipingzhangella rawalii]